MSNQNDDFSGFGSVSYVDDNKSMKTKAKKIRLTLEKNETEKTLICRILPPMKSMKDNPAGWEKWYGEHWGYKGVNAYKEGELRNRPFKCIEQRDFKTGMVRAPCPACEKIAQVAAEKMDRETKLKAAGKTPEEIKDLCAPLDQFLKQYTLNKSWWMNVMTTDGEFACLGIGSKLNTELRGSKEVQGLLKELKEKGIDPISPTEGVWLKFTRTGQWYNTKYSVRAVTDLVDVPGEGKMEKTRRAPLSAEQAKKAVEFCLDLGTEVVSELSFSQIKQIVEGSQDPEEIDRIWAQGVVTEGSPVRSAPKPFKEVAKESSPAAPVAVVSKDNELSDEDFMAKYAPKRA